MLNEIIPSGEVWDRMMTMAETLVRSGFLPKQIDTPAKAVAIMHAGYELRMSPRQALEKLYFVDGHIGMLATEMHARILTYCPEAKIKFLNRSVTVCRIQASRPGQDPEIFEFTIDDARRANLLKGVNWQKYPRPMLRSRCIAEMARSMFPDCLGPATHTPEELGATVKVDPLTEEFCDVDVETLELESGPVEIYDGTPAQEVAVKTLLRGEGLDPQRSAVFLAKLRGNKPMSQIPEIIAREAKKLRDKINAGPTGQQEMVDRQRSKVGAAEEKRA